MCEFKKINSNDAKIIKKVLLTARLEYPIDIEKGGKRILFNQLSASRPEEDTDTMMRRYLQNKDGSKPFEINNKRHSLYIRVGDWAYNPAIPDSHIVLGTDFNALGERFAQLEMSHCIQDNESIYFLKKTKLSGEASIMRLFSALKTDKELKRKRIDELKRRLNRETIDFEDEEWIVFSKINKNDLNYEDKWNEALTDFLNYWIESVLIIEEVILELRYEQNIVNSENL